MTIRLLLSGDHPVVLRALEALLDLEPGFEVNAVCPAGEQIAETVERLEPDVLLMDAATPGRDGLEALDRVRAQAPQAPTVILSAGLADDTLLDLLESGAEGLVLKEAPPSELFDAIRAVARGERWIDSGLTARALELLSGARTDREYDLTPREKEVVHHVANGMSNKGVAGQLGISVSTVKHHLQAAFQKLGVANRTQLSLVARERGWI